MNKRIVVITSFAESHLLKCLIPNAIEVLNPDKIYISEGLMKNGPENKKELDLEFRKKWCYPNTNAGFDWEETIRICQEYPDLVSYGWNSYDMDNAVDAYKHSITNYFEETDLPEIGDTIICLEADSFLHESDKYIIDEELSKLPVGEGLSIKYVDFLETQFYTEMVNLQATKYRRFAYKFDNIDNFAKAMSEGFMTQNYPSLRRTDKFFARHYCWWRPEPWKQLRFELIYRSDPQYWKDFDNGLQEIKKHSNDVGKYEDHLEGAEFILRPIKVPNKILIRPSRQDEARWAKFIDISHPKHIFNHPNYVK